MPDYPDWTRLFHLVGTDITIPISIEASTVTLPVSIDAATATVGVNIEASTVTLPVSIDAATATVGVNIEATAVTLPVSIDAATVTINVALGSLPFETTAENVLQNPGFEEGDLTGWAAPGAGTVTVQSAQVWKGSYACQLDTDPASWTWVIQLASIPCYPGQRLLVNAALKADADIARSDLTVDFRSAEDESIETVHGTDYGANYDWDPKVATFVVPDGAAFARVGASFLGGAAGGIGYADSFLVVRLLQPALDESLNLNINIVAQEIAALDINIAASAITVNINFTDQSVAVFDAAKWFSRQNAQVFVRGGAICNDNWYVDVASRVVPTGKVYYLCGISLTVNTNAATPESVVAVLWVGAAEVFSIGGYRAASIILDVPLRFNAGTSLFLRLVLWGAGAACYMVGDHWGYDEEA